MRIGTHNEYLELEELERLPDNLPGAGDVNLSVTLRLQSFSGSYDGIWLAHKEMREFVAQLVTLGKRRTGSARLSAMSPGEFTLEIRSTDALGHFEIDTQLHRHQFSGPGYRPIYLKGGFELESDGMMQLRSYFAELTR